MATARCRTGCFRTLGDEESLPERASHELGLHRVPLEHSVENDASRRMALRCGFIEEGVRRGANLHTDGWHDMRLYAHLATD